MSPACGDPSFEICARQAVRSSGYDIDFKNSAFQPDKTGLSRSRYDASKRSDGGKRLVQSAFITDEKEGVKKASYTGWETIPSKQE